MKRNSTTLLAPAFSILILMFLFSSNLIAQPYCSPSFVNGCSQWNSQSITLGTINWNIGSDPCTNSDYTFISTSLSAGGTYPMTVVNGNWCGCAVWIDFNQDFNFDAGENLFYQYLANQNNTYNFNISIPSLIPVGTYRMRVISPWGSDGYSITNINGYGSCGGYQYGNFTDFTINVTAPTGVNDFSTAGAVMSALMSHSTHTLTVKFNDLKTIGATLQLTDITGRLIEERIIQSEKELFDMNALRSGIYFLNYSDGTRKQTVKIIY